MAIDFEKMLTGGHPNSLGRTIEATEIVLADKKELKTLFNCYQSQDEVVRLRVSNAMKRIFRKNPEWYKDYANKFYELSKTLKQPSFQWTHAQLSQEMPLSKQQTKQATKAIKEQLKSKDWIVLKCTIDFLTKEAKTNPQLKTTLKKTLPSLTKDKRKVVAKKAKESLSELKK